MEIPEPIKKVFGYFSLTEDEKNNLEKISSADRSLQQIRTFLEDEELATKLSGIATNLENTEIKVKEFSDLINPLNYLGVILYLLYHYYLLNHPLQ